MQLWIKQKPFSKFFAPFLKFAFNFIYFEKKKMTLIAYVFPKLQTAKDMVRQMSKKPPFRTLFDSQHVKEAQTFMRSALKDSYHNFSSL